MNARGGRVRSCSRSGCSAPVAGRKLCRKHYQQAWKAGEFVNAPLPPRVHAHPGSEDWREVPGFEDYCASIDGLIWSHRSNRLLKQSIAGAGYLRVGLPIGEHRTTSGYVHRLVALAWHGEPEDGQEVRHLDGNPAHNHASNLAWGTHQENVDDKKRHGTDRHTHCRKGHEFTPENEYWRHVEGRAPFRTCRTCALDWEREKRAASRCRLDHEHKHAGSTTCYIQGRCRCVPCREHHATMARKRSREKAYGRFDTGLVDAAPVREHLLMLAEHGLGYKRVAALAGIGVTPTRNLIWGRQDPGPRHGELQKRVKRETAEALLAVRPDVGNLAGGALVDARGAHRRVQALVCRGWSQSKIATAIGMSGSNFGGMLKRGRVELSTHRAICAVFDAWWDKQPPHESWHEKIAFNRSVAYAKARRWLPPLAWDDIDEDAEPAVVEAVGGVDEMAIALALLGEPVRLTPAERREAVGRLHRERWSDARIAETLHVTDRTVLRIRKELALEAFDQNDLRDRGAA